MEKNKKQKTSQTVKHTPLIWSGHSTLRYFPKRSKRICPWKDLYVDIHDTFICNRQKQINETTQRSINWTIEYIHKMELYLAIKRNVLLTYPTTQMKHKIIICWLKDVRQKNECMLYNSFYISFRKCKLTHSDRNEVSGCQGTEWGDYKEAWVYFREWKIGSLPRL